MFYLLVSCQTPPQKNRSLSEYYRLPIQFEYSICVLLLLYYFFHLAFVP